MVVTPAGDPCIIAVPYQGTLNFASFSAPERSAFLRPLCGTSATLRDVERPLATIGTQESKIKKTLFLS